MGAYAKILADSISPDGVRLITFEVMVARIVLAEFNTHRVFSRNSASSRAIPIKKMIERVMTDPYIPSSWGKNQKGMQANEEVGADVAARATSEWLRARDLAVEQARTLLAFGIHKQLTNRLLEPFMWHTIIVTATEWDNFFNLRCNPQAHPDIQVPARIMQGLRLAGTPREVRAGEWHLPLVDAVDADVPPEDMIKISAARCARVSYLTHEGKRDVAADIELHDKLLTSGHMSPFEHVARPMTKHETDSGLERPDECFSGNFRGWVQYRKTIPGEADILGAQ